MKSIIRDIETCVFVFIVGCALIASYEQSKSSHFYTGLVTFQR
jgi:hypothetical protein